MDIRGLHHINFTSETEETIAVWSRAPMIYRSGSWEKAPITLTNDLDAYFDNFLDHAFLVNGTDPNYSYDESDWSTTKNLADSPIGKYIKRYGTRLYLFGIKIAGTSYPSRVWRSDLPKNGEITWGLETGSDLAQTADDSTLTSAGSLFQTRNIKVGDPFTITSGANAGEHAVLSVTSETELELTESLSSTVANSSFWVGGNWFDVQTDDGDIGMGMGLASNELFCFKKNTLHRYNSIGNELRQVKNVPGTTSPKSIVEGPDGYLYWYHPSGIWRSNGGTSDKISNAIYDVIEGITDANQSLVVGWEENRDTIKMYVGDVTLRNGDTITDCVVKFDIDAKSFSFGSLPIAVRSAGTWLESDVQVTYAGDDSSGVFQMSTGNDFNDAAIGFELEDQVRFPEGSEAIVTFDRIRLYIDNGPDVQVMYRLLYRPTRDETRWIDDRDWTPMKGAQTANRSEWSFGDDARASGVQLKFVESSTNESFLLEKYVLYYSDVSNR